MEATSPMSARRAPVSMRDRVDRDMSVAAANFSKVHSSESRARRISAPIALAWEPANFDWLLTWKSGTLQEA